MIVRILEIIQVSILTSSGPPPSQRQTIGHSSKKPPDPRPSTASKVQCGFGGFGERDSRVRVEQRRVAGLLTQLFLPSDRCSYKILVSF